MAQMAGLRWHDWLLSVGQNGCFYSSANRSGSPSGETTREQELERRIKRLEAENAYLKKSIALKAEKRSRTARRPRS